jgi:hypothetical protein
MTIHDEIREAFNRVGTELASLNPDGTYQANSQYGVPIADDFTTQKKAEEHTLRYYTQRIHLIRQ